ALSILVAPALPSLALAILARVRPHAPGAADTDASEQPRRGHTIVCGHGRLGAIVVQLLERLGASVAVIEEDPRTAKALVQRGPRASEGDAAQPVVLARADLAHARVLVTCLPERMVVRRIVDHARTTNPALVVLARTHWEAEIHKLHELGASSVVMGEVALAIELGCRS